MLKSNFSVPLTHMHDSKIATRFFFFSSLCLHDASLVVQCVDVFHLELELLTLLVPLHKDRALLRAHKMLLIMQERFVQPLVSFFAMMRKQRYQMGLLY